MQIFDEVETGPSAESRRLIRNAQVVTFSISFYQRDVMNPICDDDKFIRFQWKIIQLVFFGFKCDFYCSSTLYVFMCFLERQTLSNNNELRIHWVAALFNAAHRLVVSCLLLNFLFCFSTDDHCNFDWKAPQSAKVKIWNLKFPIILKRHQK